MDGIAQAVVGMLQAQTQTSVAIAAIKSQQEAQQQVVQMLGELSLNQSGAGQIINAVA